MTVGEKIQFYRKRNGLSQEELGQKILVSRQTVSLWEMDKTLPTVDNLLRLKEVFSVSIDDILDTAHPQEDNQIKPKESYIFQYKKEDLAELSKKEPLAAMTPLVIILILLFISTTSNQPNILTLFLFAIIALSMLAVVFRRNRKNWKMVEERLLACTYYYDVFDEYFILRIFREGDLVRTQKIFFNDIKQTQHLGNFLILYYAGESLPIPKDALIPESVFTTFRKDAIAKEEPKPLSKTSNFISILLMVLSVCAICIMPITTMIFTQTNHLIFEEMFWISFLALPIPITSIIYGFYLKKKGFMYLQNIIAGLISIVMLSCFGSISFISSQTYSHNEEPIKKIEQLLDMDIPPHSRINTTNWTTGTQSAVRGYIYFTSNIYFKETAVEEFEEAISKDSRWMSVIPNDMIGITSHLFDTRDHDYYLIYNEDTKEINQLPGKSGTYTFINISYDAENNIMKLVKYKIDYLK